MLSLFWGLLAFTQKSLAAEDTDCIRYYEFFELFEGIEPLYAISSLNILELLNFVFMPASVLVISITGNVQSISFLWTFIVYFLMYMSIRRLMIFYGCYTQRQFAIVVLITTFCFMVFVQITELLKNSAAFTVFFYGFTLYMTNGNKVAVIGLIIASIGIHPSVIMLLPLLLYRKVNTKIVLVISCVVLLISLISNVLGSLINILPGGGYFDLVLDRFGDYDISQSGTLHYIAIQMAMLCSALFLLCKNKGKDERLNDAVNIVILYFIVSVLNYYNLTAYLRFSIFSHWLFALILIWYVQKASCNYNVRRIMKCLVVFMFLMTLRWTLARTIGGGYCSSYMDNSIINIVFSTSSDYLSVEYEK
ncbi:MAG: EpsG family protein [Bacteroides intestinalis]|uniref:EpsG family protein n=1 Tax=Bacteroides intestinalis TaxID=329854 RepID=UPI003036F009